YDLAAEFPRASVLGVDVSQRNIAAAEAARERHALVAPRCAFERRDLLGGEMPGGYEPPGPWDLVVMRETLCHVSHKRRFLGVLRRWLKTGCELRLTDLVQRRAAGPSAWSAVLESGAFT